MSHRARNHALLGRYGVTFMAIDAIAIALQRIRPLHGA